jgi:hypothetical protein
MKGAFQNNVYIFYNIQILNLQIKNNLNNIRGQIDERIFKLWLV